MNHLGNQYFQIVHFDGIWFDFRRTGFFACEHFHAVTQHVQIQWLEYKIGSTVVEQFFFHLRIVVGTGDDKIGRIDVFCGKAF